MSNLKKGSVEWKVVGAVIIQHAENMVKSPMPQEAIDAYIEATGEQPPHPSEEETFEAILNLLDMGVCVILWDEKNEVVGIHTNLPNEVDARKKSKKINKRFTKAFSGEYQRLKKSFKH